MTIDEIITRAFESHPGFSSFSSSPAAATFFSSYEDDDDNSANGGAAAHQEFIARVDPEEAAEGHSLRELDMMLTKKQQINLYQDSVFYESFIDPSYGMEGGYGPRYGNLTY